MRAPNLFCRSQRQFRQTWLEVILTVNVSADILASFTLELTLAAK